MVNEPVLQNPLCSRSGPAEYCFCISSIYFYYAIAGTVASRHYARHCRTITYRDPRIFGKTKYEAEIGSKIADLISADLERSGLFQLLIGALLFSRSPHFRFNLGSVIGVRSMLKL